MSYSQPEIVALHYVWIIRRMTPSDGFQYWNKSRGMWFTDFDLKCSKRVRPSYFRSPESAEKEAAHIRKLYGY